MRNTAFSALWLTVVWVLLWGQLTWANVVFGLLLALLVLWVFPLPRFNSGIRVRPVALVIMYARFQWDLVLASVAVAWQALWPWRRTKPGVLLQVRLRSDNPWHQTLTAELTALVPGTLVIDLDSEQRLLTIHALGAHSMLEAREAHDRILAQEGRVIAALPQRERRSR